MNGLEYIELARAVHELAESAPLLEADALVTRWPEIERRVLARVRAEEYEGSAQGGLGEGIRNLAWEIGVSVDLHAVHLGALRTLADLLRERGQQLAMRSSRDLGSRARASRPDSNAG